MTVLDLLLGRLEHTSRDMTSKHLVRSSIRYVKTASGEMKLGIVAVVAMPEGNYPAVVRFTEDAWRRARLPRAHRVVRRAHVEMLVPIPATVGRQDEYTYSMTLAASTVLKAVTGVATTVMLDRKDRANRPKTVEAGR